MMGYPDLDISLKGVNKEAIIYDIVYNPINTKLINKARKEKLKYITGLDMFVGQARKSFELWFKILPKVDGNIFSILKKEISRR